MTTDGQFPILRCLISQKTMDNGTFKSPEIDLHPTTFDMVDLAVLAGDIGRMEIVAVFAVAVIPEDFHSLNQVEFMASHGKNRNA